MSGETRIGRLRKRAESPFTRNQYGLWCPNCGERIDEFWPESCDACGYPDPDHETFGEDDHDH